MSEVRIYADIRPIGPTGTLLVPSPTSRDGIAWRQVGIPEIIPALTINSFTVAPSAVLCGTGLVNPVFTASYNYLPTAAWITVGTGRLDLVSPFTSGTGTFNLGTGVFASGHTFTLTASGGYNVTTATTNSVYMQPFYLGIDYLANYDAIVTQTDFDNFVISLSTGILCTGFSNAPSGSFLTNDAKSLFFFCHETNPDVSNSKVVITDLNSSLAGFMTYHSYGTFRNQAGHTDKYGIYISDYPVGPNISPGLQVRITNGN